jgi:dTDP-4-dehydrorhamnose reductase
VILLTGAEGQIGWELRRALAPLGRVIALRRVDVDLADADHLRAVIREVAPTHIVNAAGFTAVDRAESQRDLAFAVNARAPKVMAEEAARLGAGIVHYSTDYVFDGTKRTPYREDDPVAPLSVYGSSKLEGDRAVACAGAPYLILRTSWVYGARGGNFLRTILRLAHERSELRVVADQFGAPTPARLVAEITAQLLGPCSPAMRTSLLEHQTGIYNVSSRGSVSWHAFACAILALDGQRERQTVTGVAPITTEEYPAAARRPAYSVLDSAKLEQTFGLRMPHWHEQLELVMSEPALVRP